MPHMKKIKVHFLQILYSATVPIKKSRAVMYYTHSILRRCRAVIYYTYSILHIFEITSVLREFT